MAEQAGGYFREPLHGERGVTEGDPPSPTILNVVVDAVVRYWETLVAKQAGGGQQRWQRQQGADGGKYNPGKGCRPTVSGGGACNSDGEGRALLCRRQTGGFHQIGVNPVYV